jgi:HAD superfamily hydrolase (TIGR01549 family)
MTDGQLPRRYKAIFFDMFGTLASGATDDDAHMHLMESLVDRYNIATEPPLLLQRFNDSLRGPSPGPGADWVTHRELVRRTLDRILEDHGLDVHPADEDWFYEEYLRKHQSFVRLFPGAREALEQVSRVGLHLGMVADCDTEYLDRQMCWLDIVKFFDSRTTSEEVKARKPDERIFRAALQKAHSLPQQAIFVGDSVDRDILGAKALGMTTVLVDTRMVRTELAEADFVASHMSRMATILVELAYSP